MNTLYGIIALLVIIFIYAWYIRYILKDEQNKSVSEIMMAVDEIEGILNRTTTGNLSHQKGNMLQGLNYLKMHAEKIQK